MITITGDLFFRITDILCEYAKDNGENPDDVIKAFAYLLTNVMDKISFND